MNQSRHAPYRLTAAALALLVHGAFFAFLYLGIDWHTDQPQGMVVDIWDNLPVADKTPPPAAPAEPPPPPPPPSVVEKVAPPKPVPQPTKAEIEFKDKKKPTKEQPVKQPPVKEKTPPPPKKVVEPPKVTAEMRAEQAAKAAQEKLQAERDRLNAEQAVAAGRVLDEYAAKIRSKIKHNVVMPPDVADEAKAEFDVTLLPGGMVLGARLTKSSGNAAYDSAVERAILKSQPLPLAPDVTLFNRFSNLHLKFSPVE
ncbi:MAG: cell envelope integrity protein TolA [Nitrosomonadales bacterium]|nr:cell envelope integrity protein TolA [Nitrosomonadales bacterium]